MKAFRFTSVAELAGAAVAVTVQVDAVKREANGFSCSYDWLEAGLSRRFSGQYPETLFRRVCRHVRFQMWRRGIQLRDADGRPQDFMPPALEMASGNSRPFFEPVVFDHFARYADGTEMPINIRIGSPILIQRGPARYRCDCECSLFAEPAPNFGDTSDDAFAWAFVLVRRVLRSWSVDMVDSAGRVLPVTAPLPGEQP